MAETYTCEMCGKTYEKGRTDEEAIAEMKEHFGEVPKEEQATICDDCFNKIHPDKFPIATRISKATNIQSR